MDFNKKQKSQKMEKTKFYIMALLVAFMGMAVSSCSSDDDDVSPIVGTWEKTTTSGGIGQFVFNSDNTGSMSLHENGSKLISYFIYKYNESDSSIIITFEYRSEKDFSGYFLYLVVCCATRRSARRQGHDERRHARTFPPPLPQPPSEASVSASF